MMCIILAAVLPFRFQPGAYLNPQIRSHGHIPDIKELVQVRAKQNPVTDAMRTLQCVRSDVSRLEHRERLFPSDGAAPLVGIGHEDAERALTEPAARQVFSTESILLIRAVR